MFPTYSTNLNLAISPLHSVATGLRTIQFLLSTCICLSGSRINLLCQSVPYSNEGYIAAYNAARFERNLHVLPFTLIF
jgi:hypothetical protein